MEFDIEQIIAAVEKFPALYDKDHDLFSSRRAKQEAWMRVTEAVVGERFTELSPEEINEIGRDIMRRWKTTRDTFLRSLKGRFGEAGGKRKRPYMYARHLSFLLPTVESWPSVNYMESEDMTNGPSVEDAEIVNLEEPSTDASSSFGDAEMGRASETQNSMRTTPYDRQQYRLMTDSHYNDEMPYEQHFTDQKHFTDQMPYEPFQDPEKMFLLSLLPKMKKLNSPALFDFEIKCMQLLQKYLQNPTNLRSHHYQTSNSTPTTSTSNI